MTQTFFSNSLIANPFSFTIVEYREKYKNNQQHIHVRMDSIVNKKVLKTLEFDKIIDMLVEEADSSLGKDRVRRLRPSSDQSEIVALQAETSHALTRLFHHGSLSFHGLTDIRPSLVPLSKGGTLGAGELLRIGALLEAAKRAVEFDKKDEETDFLSGRFNGLQTFPEIRQEIHRCILSEEEISDDASS